MVNVQQGLLKAVSTALDEQAQSNCLLDVGVMGYGGHTIVASNIQAGIFCVRDEVGNPLVQITPEMGEGKFEITDDYFVQLLNGSPEAQQAFAVLLCSIEDTVVEGGFRETQRRFFNLMMNQFHKDLTARVNAVNNRR